MGLNTVRWSPVGLPAGAQMQSIATFPVDTTRNAVNQNGVGGFPAFAASNRRANPTNMPFTSQPGPVYGNHSVALHAGQPYRATAGWTTTVATFTPLQPYLLAGVPRSGGSATAQAVQQRVLALIAMRQRTTPKKRKV